jgi:hypothetical protein
MAAARALDRFTANPVVPGVLWGVTYIAARLALELDLPSRARLLIALAPVLPFLLALVGVVRGIRSMDELHRRVHLEALVLAFPLTLLFIMTLGLLELAVGLSPDDWSYRHILPFLVMFYAFGLWRAWKRYL